MSQNNSNTRPSQSKDELSIEHDDKQKDCDMGAPIERYHGEKTNKHVGDEGDLDEATLDEDAPFNKTYGREKPNSTNE